MQQLGFNCLDALQVGKRALSRSATLFALAGGLTVWGAAQATVSQAEGPRLNEGASGEAHVVQTEPTPVPEVQKDGTAFDGKSTHRLTYISGIDLEIGFRGTKGEWCNKRLDLVFVTSQPTRYRDTEFLNNQVGSLIRKLHAACPILVAVSVEGFLKGDLSKPLLVGSYVAEDQWAFFHLPLPKQTAAPPFAENQGQAGARAEQPSLPQQGAQTPPIAQPPGNNRELTLSETAELQSRLNFIGINAGPANGTRNGQTVAAISAFLDRSRLNLPRSFNLQVLEAVRHATGARRQLGQSPAQSQQPQNQQRPFNPAEFRNIGDPRQFSLDRELSLRILNANPRLLNNDSTVLAWLEADSRENLSPVRNTALTLKQHYKNGTQFEKEDVIVRYRALLTQELNARRLTLTQPVKLVMINRAAFSNKYYVEGKGFSIQTQLNSLYSKRFSMSITFPAPTPKQTRFVPILDEQSKRRFATLIENDRNRFETRYYFELQPRVNLTEDRSNALKAHIETREVRYELVMKTGRQNTNSLSSQLLYVWPLRQETAQSREALIASTGGRGLTPQQFAQWANITVRRNHLVWTENRDRGQSLSRLFGFERSSFADRYEVFGGWAIFKGLATLLNNPALLTNEQVVLHVASTFLTEQEKAALARGKNFLDPLVISGTRPPDYNEFEFHAFYQRLIQSRAVELYRRIIPQLPLPIVEIVQVRLGRYDYAKNSFVLEREGRPLNTFLPILKMDEFKSYSLKQYPGYLYIPEDRAEFLIDYLAKRENRKHGKRTVFLAVFSDVVPGNSNDPNPANIAFTVKAKGVSLFASPDLTDESKIADYPLEPLLVDVFGSTGPGLADILTAPPVTKTHLLKHALALAKDDTAVDRIVRSSSRFLNANELDQIQIGLELSRELTAPTPYAPPYLITGEINLGAYDVGRQQFGIRGWPDFRFSSDGSFGAPIELVIANADTLSNFDADEQTARRVFAQSTKNDRRFPFRALITPVSANVPDGKSSVKMSVLVNEIVVLNKAQNGEAKQVLIRKRIPANDNRSAAATGQQSGTRNR